MTPGRAGGRTRRVKVHDDPAATLPACPRPIRQLAVTGLGHDQPTLLITNQAQLPARQVIQACARRMNTGQRLAEAIASFGPGPLAGAVPAQRRPRRRALRPGPHPLRRAAPPPARIRNRHPGTPQRRFLSAGGIITTHRGTQVTVKIEGTPLTWR